MQKYVVIATYDAAVSYVNNVIGLRAALKYATLHRAAHKRAVVREFQEPSFNTSEKRDKNGRRYFTSRAAAQQLVSGMYCAAALLGKTAAGAEVVEI